MKPNNGYFTAKIHHTPYLLPFGQAAEDRLPGMRINESGSLLWDALCRGADEEELLQVLKSHWNAGAKDLPMLRRDLSHFLDSLYANGLLEQETAHSDPFTRKQHFLKIGPLRLAIFGPEKLISSCFGDFTCGPGDADLTVSFHFGKPSFRRSGEILVRNDSVIICSGCEDYILIYPDSFPLLELHIKKDGSNACIYCMPSFDGQLWQEAFHAIRFAFLVLAQQRNLYVLHSSSILYQGKAWLFSGRSGAGKSTHAALWQEVFGTPVLNGDLNMIGMEHGIPMVYGLPWCGTSGVSSSENVPLSGITLLKQAPENRIIPLSEEEQILSVMQRMISPSWTSGLLEKNLAFAGKLAEKTTILRLLCTKDTNAAHLMKQTIDSLQETSGDLGKND